MKHFIQTLLLLSTFCYGTIAQSKQEIENFRNYFSKSITVYHHKNIVYTDTLGYDAEFISDTTKPDPLNFRRFAPRISFANALHKSKKYTLDSIPEVASVNINGIVFEHKEVLPKVANHEILVIKKDSSYFYKYYSQEKAYRVVARYRRPTALVYQSHSQLPHDFFIFKQYSLEPIRYRTYTHSPVLDVFNTEDTITYTNTPRVMIDGRLQPKTFDYQRVNLKDVKEIEVFAKEDASRYFGKKAKSGLISIVTHGSNFNLSWMLANTRVVGEMQDKAGNWKVITDTLLTSLEQFREFRKNIFKNNGAVYLINGEFETEEVNRKTTDLDAVESISIISGKRLIRTPQVQSGQSLVTYSEVETIGNDTIQIKTEKERWTARANTSIARVLSDLKRLQNPLPEPTPIYIVDNQEISSEKLKEFKTKDLEFVESLEGCDAISKYGKRAEYGVVIYRKKKEE
ncbi:MAG: hypothetical protein MUF58_12120 [Arcicella sp.]|jgi:hypothetical protein|nr:hypothetical protein [Arcicella sp.]